MILKDGLGDSLSNDCHNIFMKFKSEKYSGNCSHHHDHIRGSRDPGVHFKKGAEGI